MTLIISMVNRDQAVIVSDRRLVSTGRYKDRHMTKCGVLRARDAYVGYAITGMAEMFYFDTTEWLAETLADVAPPDFSIWGMMPRLRDAATATWRDRVGGNHRDKCVSFVFAGYVTRPDDGRVTGMSWTLSNFEFQGYLPTDHYRLAEASAQFGLTKTYTDDDHPATTLAYGADDAVSTTEWSDLTAKVEACAAAPELVDAAIAVIRNASARDAHAGRNRIGDDCMSIVIPREHGATVDAAYHPPDAKGTLYAPDVVDVVVGSISRNTLVLNPAALTRDSPCPCGSGRLITACHGAPGAPLSAIFDERGD